MKKFAARQISHLYSALLIAGVLLNLCVAPAASLGDRQPQQDVQSFSSVASGAHSHALTTGSRALTELPLAKPKRAQHPLFDFTALRPEGFQLSAASFGQGALDCDQFAFRSSFSVRPQGRAPPAFV